MIVRAERTGDIDAIREVNLRAFGQPQEADLVDALRANGAVLASLVAVSGGSVVGHILYTPVTIDCDGREIGGAGLGPMAVLPERQGEGIGGRLIEAGSRVMSEQGHPFVIVVGHPGYYPRFGFEPAERYGLRCEWEVPREAFMVCVLEPARMAGVSGRVKYREEFSRYG